MISLKIKRLHKDAIVPEYKTKGSSGMDLHILLDEEPQGKYLFYPEEIKIFNTGISMEIPEGYELQIRPRSGMACLHGITVVNSPGTIDSDYRGEIKVALINNGRSHYVLSHLERVAQGVLCPIVSKRGVLFSVVDELEGSERGEGGFGSTGRD